MRLESIGSFSARGDCDVRRYTPSLALLFGLRESLNMLAAEGMNNVVKRHKR